MIIDRRIDKLLNKSPMFLKIKNLNIVQCTVKGKNDAGFEHFLITSNPMYRLHVLTTLLIKALRNGYAIKGLLLSKLLGVKS